MSAAVYFFSHASINHFCPADCNEHPYYGSIQDLSNLAYTSEILAMLTKALWQIASDTYTGLICRIR